MTPLCTLGKRTHDVGQTCGSEISIHTSRPQLFGNIAPCAKFGDMAERAHGVGVVQPPPCIVICLGKEEYRECCTVPLTVRQDADVAEGAHDVGVVQPPAGERLQFFAHVRVRAPAAAQRPADLRCDAMAQHQGISAINCPENQVVKRPSSCTRQNSSSRRCPAARRSARNTRSQSPSPSSGMSCWSEVR